MLISYSRVATESPHVQTLADSGPETSGWRAGKQHAKAQPTPSFSVSEG